MLSSASYLLRHSQRRPLAAGMAALFAVSAPGLSCAASTWTVNSCDQGNSGTGMSGTLRYAVANAASGDTVDMSGLGCSTITLTTGAITIARRILTLRPEQASSRDHRQERQLDRARSHHQPYLWPARTTGHLYIDNLSMGYGQFTSAVGGAHGGCIRSPGSVTLTNVGVYFCTATTSVASGASALGGGVYAHSGLTIKDKTNLLHNTVSAINSGVRSEGGGAYTQGPFDMSDSSVAYNQALGPNKTRRWSRAARQRDHNGFRHRCELFQRDRWRHPHLQRHASRCHDDDFEQHDNDEQRENLRRWPVCQFGNGHYQQLDNRPEHGRHLHLHPPPDHDYVFAAPGCR